MNIHNIWGYIDIFDVNIDDHGDQHTEVAATSPLVDGGQPTVQTGNCSMNMHDIGGDVDNCDVNTDDHGDEHTEVAATSPPVDGGQPTVQTGNLLSSSHGEVMTFIVF